MFFDKKNYYLVLFQFLLKIYFVDQFSRVVFSRKLYQYIFKVECILKKCLISSANVKLTHFFTNNKNIQSIN